MRGSLCADRRSSPTRTPPPKRRRRASIACARPRARWPCPRTPPTTRTGIASAINCVTDPRSRTRNHSHGIAAANNAQTRLVACLLSRGIRRRDRGSSGGAMRDGLPPPLHGGSGGRGRLGDAFLGARGHPRLRAVSSVARTWSRYRHEGGLQRSPSGELARDPVAAHRPPGGSMGAHLDHTRSCDAHEDHRRRQRIRRPDDRDARAAEGPGGRGRAHGHRGRAAAGPGARPQGIVADRAFRAEHRRDERLRGCRRLRRGRHHGRVPAAAGDEPDGPARQERRDHAGRDRQDRAQRRPTRSSSSSRTRWTR